MNGHTASRLVEALIVGIAAASAWYLEKRRPAPVRSAYPDLAGNFAL
jgi:hypothetical protein